MKGFSAIYRKEMYSLFASPIFYVVAFTFLMVQGYFFYSTVAYFSLMSMQAAQNPMMAMQLNVTDMVLRPLFNDVNIVLLLVAPILTMRAFAEERKTGTIELLYTWPVTDRTALLAKYAGLLTVYAVVLAATLPHMAVLVWIGSPSLPVMATGYLGLFLFGGAFLALGVFTSSLTHNQIVAAVLAFGLGIMLWIIGWMKSVAGPALGGFFEYVSLMGHFETFSKGVLDSRDLLYYVMFIAFFLFLTLRQVESYRWRG